MYNKWKVDKSSVHPVCNFPLLKYQIANKNSSQSWNRVFADDTYWSGQDENSSVKSEPRKSSGNVDLPINEHTATDSKSVEYATIKSHINVHSLIKSYQQRGHLVADLDPLGITSISVKDDHGVKRRADESVTKNYFDFSASDMEKEFFLPASTFIGGPNRTLKLRFVKLK